MATKIYIDKKLNESWGNVFWSMEYNNFEEIELPNLKIASKPLIILIFKI